LDATPEGLRDYVSYQLGARSAVARPHEIYQEVVTHVCSVAAGS